jgi:uncharacterized iron-regulated membrane protein
MKSLRKIVFWLHLGTGLAAALVVVIMSATGVLLTYQKQITALADRQAVNALPPTVDTRRLGVDELISRAASSAKATPTSLTLRSRWDAPAELQFGRDRRELVNAYSGQLLGEGSTTTGAFFRSVTAWHRTLAATGENRATGKAITGAANLGFLFLVFSGICLWFPRNWSRSAFRNVTWFRRRLSGKARDFNWHNVIGFWSAIPLVAIVASGVVISYQWGGNLVYRLVGERAPAPAPAAPRTERDGAESRGDERVAAIASGLDGMVAAATTRSPDWTTITMNLPTASAKTVTLSIDRGSGGQPQLRSQLVLDRATTSEIRYEQFSAQSRGRRLRSILRFAHTGEVLGVAGQTVAGLASLGSVVLAVTGIMLAIRRAMSWQKRRAWRREAAVDQARDIEVAA